MRITGAKQAFNLSRYGIFRIEQTLSSFIDSSDSIEIRKIQNFYPFPSLKILKVTQ